MIWVLYPIIQRKEKSFFQFFIFGYNCSCNFETNPPMQVADTLPNLENIEISQSGNWLN